MLYAVAGPFGRTVSELSRTRFLILMLAAPFCAALAGGASAQTFYGGLDGALTYTDTFDADGDDFGREPGADFSGFAGWTFGRGLFAEGEARVKYAEYTFGNGIQNLQESSLLALRFGIVRPGFTGEAILGYLEETNEDGMGERSFAALAGSYDLSDRFVLTGLAGYLDGEGGTDERGLGPARELAHVSLGGAYEIGDRLILWASAAYGDGVMNADRDAAYIKEAVFGLDYRLADPALKAYGAVTYADYHQEAGGDVYETRVSLGLSWTFGDAGSRGGRSRPALPAYENWAATTGGTLN
jgi:hypothetical protein